ncbi:hypothetical protein CCAX7_14490 [Capsulimonas corticalis]|uniref:Uncharacterized protein n=1 Tax=Capsulimonas corticalis TaxID=2219043 RepID=A0A402CZJ0_9BACT|nr:hypothetical protein [Capsulimonas corticalis]BDI29398.1 hypothetical protein CCAX7_14490 [Capsulimonas corticalis]
MPREAGAAFLLWARAAHSGDWDFVLKAPLTAYSAIAVHMLQECPSYANYEAKRQSGLLSMMLKQQGG